MLIQSSGKTTFAYDVDVVEDDEDDDVSFLMMKMILNAPFLITLIFFRLILWRLSTIL